MLYNARGLLAETFVLVETPSALYAGFHHTLERLQQAAASSEQIAFSQLIAPTSASSSPKVSLPAYASSDDFVYKLDCLRTNGGLDMPPINLRPSELTSNPTRQTRWVDRLCQETTLDQGQAAALCEILCRNLAFTQGPPGTGKTYVIENFKSARIAAERQQIPRCEPCKSSFGVSQPQFATANIGGLYDKSCLGQLLGRHSTSGSNQDHSSRFEEQGKLDEGLFYASPV